jgi:hypothetical protein
VSQTSRSRVTKLDAWDQPYASGFSNVLRLVEDDTAAPRQIRNRHGSCRVTRWGSCGTVRA